jgi:transcriptional regulator with XRE-family HTH domain
MDTNWIKRAKQLMDEQGVTQHDLIKVMKVNTRGAISHYFTEIRKPGIKKLNDLAEYLNVSPQYLIFGGDKNREVNGKLLTQCFKVVRNLNEQHNLDLSEDQQVQLVIFIYNASQKDEGIKLLSEKQILDAARLLTNSFS